MIAEETLLNLADAVGVLRAAIVSDPKAGHDLGVQVGTQDPKAVGRTQIGRHEVLGELGL